MQFMLRFLRIMRDYTLMLTATNYAQYYAGIMYASLNGRMFACGPYSVGVKYVTIHMNRKRMSLKPIWCRPTIGSVYP